MFLLPKPLFQRGSVVFLLWVAGCTPTETPSDPELGDRLFGAYHSAYIEWQPSMTYVNAGYRSKRICPSDSVLLALNADGTFSVRMTVALTAREGIVFKDTVVAFVHQGTFSVPRARFVQGELFGPGGYWTGTISFLSDDGFGWSSDFRKSDLGGGSITVYILILKNSYGTVLSTGWSAGPPAPCSPGEPEDAPGAIR